MRYEPAESESGVFGGNSNWRGPIWFPINYLLIEALQKFHHYYGDDFLVECPTGSGTMRTLWQIAEELSCRLMHIFLRDPHGRRPVFGSNEVFQTDPHWHDYLLFHEYFHGDTGAGLTLLLVVYPYLPYLNRLPYYLGVHRLIWREYYHDRRAEREYAGGGASPAT